jgi:hypothetical protein
MPDLPITSDQPSTPQSATHNQLLAAALILAAAILACVGIAIAGYTGAGLHAETDSALAVTGSCFALQTGNGLRQKDEKLEVVLGEKGGLVMEGGALALASGLPPVPTQVEWIEDTVPTGMFSDSFGEGTMFTATRGALDTTAKRVWVSINFRLIATVGGWTASDFRLVLTNVLPPGCIVIGQTLAGLSCSAVATVAPGESQGIFHATCVATANDLYIFRINAVGGMDTVDVGKSVYGTVSGIVKYKVA